MKLLIVEDQAKTGQYLRQGLSEAGFTTELAADGIRVRRCLMYSTSSTTKNSTM